ncbi:MAG TPA: hypothetical protein VFM88_23635 [Vicinamibacteria bacterium]|nr:hypothetical protein [Vicinamibacteria bacterium]
MKRDLQILRRIVAMIVSYWVDGGRLRRAYRGCEARGEVFWVDAGGPTRHREHSMREGR